LLNILAGMSLSIVVLILTFISLGVVVMGVDIVRAFMRIIRMMDWNIMNRVMRSVDFVVRILYIVCFGVVLMLMVWHTHMQSWTMMNWFSFILMRFLLTYLFSKAMSLMR